MDIAEARNCLPQYQLAQTLRAGAQGDVFRGNAPDGRDIVVKIISGAWVQRGEREIRALALVNHPAVVRLVGHGMVDCAGNRLPFMATEFIEGEDLRYQLDTATFHTAAAPRLVSSLAEGLDAIWAQQIVHRDIKPANIMVRPDGRGVLLDLGVARCLGMTTLTVGTGSPGTLGYLSPEQARGVRNLTTKSDVYSLGVTAYEAVVGDHPFGRDQILMMNASRPPTVRGRARCSNAMADLIAAMMEPLPAMRPMPREVVTALAGEVT
ncbi:MAG: serine/threonine protein kinase [Actinobacteria bacterium]|nr:serine/threonine protein kinase [Actinomycetota bacterium]